MKNYEIKDAKLSLIIICIEKPASAAAMDSVYATPETAIDTWLRWLFIRKESS